MEKGGRKPGRRRPVALRRKEKGRYQDILQSSSRSLWIVHQCMTTLDQPWRSWREREIEIQWDQDDSVCRRWVGESCPYLGPAKVAVVQECVN